MEIKGLHDLYPYRSVGNTGRNVRTAPVKSAPVVKESAGEVDKVNISPEASFRAKLETLSKTYAAQVQKQEVDMPSRVEALKAQYQGDACPVSGQDVAKAIMNMVFGT